MHCLEPELSLDEDKRDQHCSCPRVQQTFTKASHCWLSVLLVFKKISGCSPTKKKITKTSKCPWQEWTLKSKLILSPNEDSLLIGILLLLLLENAPELQSSPKGFFFFFSLFFAPFISCEGPYFPLSCHLCTRRKYPCLLRKWTSISKWLTVYLQFNCFLNLNRLISSSKLNKKEDLKKKKTQKKSCLCNWFLSVLMEHRVSQGEFLMRCSPAVKCTLQAGDSASQRGRNELQGH